MPRVQSSSSSSVTSTAAGPEVEEVKPTSAAAAREPGSVPAQVLALAGGAAANKAEAEAETSYGRISDALSHGIANWSISDADAHATLGELEKLPPKDFNAALSRLHDDGLLERLTGHLSSRDQTRFLELCRKNGRVHAEGGRPVEGSFDPPAIPNQYRLEYEQLPEVRDLAHLHNIGTMAAYHASYRQYVERYKAALQKAETLPKERQIGPPVQREDLTEPRDTKLYDDPWLHQFIDYGETQSWCGGGELEAYEAVKSRYDAIIGRTPAGRSA